MRKLIVVLMLVLAGYFLVPQSLSAGSRADLWKEVQKAIGNGLPKTAIKQLEPIITGALKDKAYSEAIKAISKKIILEGNIQGNKPGEMITRMKAEISKVPSEMHPIMDTILANWYWQYFQRNKYRILHRTQTSASPGPDLATWDLPRILAEIDKQFTRALSVSEILKKTAVAEYDDLLEKGRMPDKYRPTLYDFIVYNALHFYCSGEQAAAKREDAFDLLASSPVFAPTEEFVKWKIKTTDSNSLTVKAIHLFQDLLEFHQDDKDRSAWLDADLQRLIFGYNKSFGEEKNVRMKVALKRFADKYSDHPISSRALYRLALVLQKENKLVKAHTVAAEGENRFSESLGGKECHNFIQSIEAKSIRISTGRVWNKPLGTIDVYYRNIKKVYFHIVPYDWKKWIKNHSNQPSWLNGKDRKEVLALKPVLSWSSDLPATTDYRKRLESIPAREDLKPGFYFLIASCNNRFNETDNQVSFTTFWYSSLALVIGPDRNEKRIKGFVLDALSGDPITGAEVHLWSRDRKNFNDISSTKTDKNGFFHLKCADRKSHIIHASFQGQELASHREYYFYNYNSKPRPFTKTIFFTDRSLYRPGQTVQYKGICIAVNEEKNNYRVIPGRDLSVVFSGRNNKEISRQRHQTNDYGSFSGSFTAPRDRLMGRMSIRVDNGPKGSVYFNVEEYKRPKFRVTLEAPKEAAKLNGQAVLTGKATGYTGAAIGGAKVRWRVVRQVLYPPWWGWCYWWRTPVTNSREIAHGTSSTLNDGSFKIKFTARPDLSVLEKDEPTFQFAVYSDVTDTAGETRSAQRVINIGYTALKASLSCDDWQSVEKPVEISISTTSLDGEGRSAEGVVRIYRLKQPEKVVRARLGGFNYQYMWSRGGQPPEQDAANPNSWPLGGKVVEKGFTTDADGRAKQEFSLEAGPYRVLLETHDQFGKSVKAQFPLKVIDPNAKKLSIRIPDLFEAPEWKLQPGDEFKALWGSGYDKARCFVEINHRGKVVKSFWSEPGLSQVQIKQKITEAMRGGFTVRIIFVRENRAYLHSRYVNVPWTNKNLSIKWEHFVSKLKPAAKETWTAVITGPKAEKVAAEMVATLYDASLDAYKPHYWQEHFNVFYQDRVSLYYNFENQLQYLNHLYGRWKMDYKDVNIGYRSFPVEFGRSFYGYELAKGLPESATIGVSRSREWRKAESLSLPFAFGARIGATATLSSKDKVSQYGYKNKLGALRAGVGGGANGKRAGMQSPTPPDLDKVASRKNLAETAFFFPHLLSNADGEVRLEFTMPEAVTEWKFLGFAHDADLRSGFIEDKVVTSKDLMVQPNPPRFLREGDEIEFTVKVSNQSASHQAGRVRLTFSDARTGKNVDALLGNKKTDQEFDVPTKESRSYSWRLSVPDGMGFLAYKVVGSTGRLSDGEEGYLPVLSRRILVTESMALPIRGKKTKNFNFTRLIESGKSGTLQSKNLVVQMVSNPAWYAVMALPYLMEYPHQCSEQVFNRLYANSLARFIAGSNPKIRRVFDQWKGTPALDSPLEKNQDLKAVMLEETPWLRQAKKESQARRNVGLLFDDNRLNRETSRAFGRLSSMQLSDGAWPWFPGGQANDYITLYITTGFGRLRHLGVDIDVSPAKRALGRLDGWINRRYHYILEHNHKDDYHLSPLIALYLYGRSFFLEDKPVSAKNKAAVDYFIGQAKKYWLQLANRQSQGHLAIALKRFGNRKTPGKIMKSIKERSVESGELGMYWRETEMSWWWYRAPIETQAVMIEAFDEVMDDAAAVEDCKVWLLKQKQTQDWKTTKATADAVYALLLRGTDLLASDEIVEVTLGDKTIKPEKVEAGTGYYEERFVGPEIKPGLGRVKVKKIDNGVSWGSIHWQYLEDMKKITAYKGTPLTLLKKLYTRKYTKKGPVLDAVKGSLHVGDELVVRIVLRVDRDMEYVHMKDQRGSGTEPVNVLSRYKFQDGLYYYESTRDMATHFFIDYLPKGTYVFEYSTRVVHRGRYQTGMAQIQCMYAPEFNSHSESFMLEVK